MVNGYDAFTLETSKALQLLLLERLGLPYPRARVVNHPSRLVSAAAGLTYPVIVKPNVGGSGALMQRFETPEDLGAAAGAGELDFGIDRTALVQEYLAPAGGGIVRVEVLDGELALRDQDLHRPGRGLQPLPGRHLPGRRDRTGAVGQRIQSPDAERPPGR